MIFELEELSLTAWPALQTVAYDGWLLRFAEGYTKRSNSVNPLYPSTLPLDKKIESCEARFRSMGLPTIFKITEAESQRHIDAALARSGYERIDETVLMTADLTVPGVISAVPSVALSPGEPGAGPRAVAHFGAASSATTPSALSLSETFDDTWIDAFCACGRHQAERGVIESILDNVIVPTIVASATEAGEIVGCGYGAIDSGWVGLFDIAVAEDMRRRGYGEAIVAAILDRAVGLGAKRAYLQVVAANVPARALYAKLGFCDSYRYWYRKKA